MRMQRFHPTLFALAILAIMPMGCARDGRFRLLGYDFGSLHDSRYRTIYVPIFENRAFQSGPLRGMEYALTEAVQKEIEATTTYKVTHSRERADTELLGTIVATPKHIINRNQLNEIREGEMIIQIEILWRDLQTGEILSKPGISQVAQPPVPAGPPRQPGMELPVDTPETLKKLPKVVVQASGRFVPELGESQATAVQRGCKKLAVQIVSLMEKPW